MKNLSIKYLTLGLSLIFIVAAALFYFQKEVKSPIKQALITKATPINYTGALPISVEDISTEATPSLTDMATAVTAEALKAFSDSGDVALPLMSHWDVGETDAMNPTYMLSRLEQGEHVLVSWKLDPYYLNTIGNAYYEESIKKAAELNLPLVFILPAPESALTEDSYYKTLAQSENPNVIDMDGNIVNKLSPFGPDHLWNEIGVQWSSTSLMAQIQEWYPNPPLVVFINENAASKLSWSEVETSSRYVDNYPSGKDDEYKRTLVGAQWIEKYRQMHTGFKEGFIKEDWKNSVKFVSYNDFSDDLGQISTWMMDATLTNQYLDICPFTVDGTTVNFDLTKSVDYTTIDAPQIPVNNLPFMLQEAKRNNPSFMQQLSITHNSDMTDPALYRGLTQFGLWFLRPSIIRQDSPTSTLTELEPLFSEMSDSVELIHNSDILSDFWKNGTLVSNGASDLNSNIPEQYIDDPRWFLLDVDANPARPWTDSSNIVAWAFALVKGEAPTREWLIYAQSPNQELSTITISIPKYNDIILSTNKQGSFYTFKEQESAQEPLEIISTNIQNIQTSNSMYLEIINIPLYDSSNSKHVLITEINGNISLINDPTKTNFYVEAGNYGTVTLTASGSLDTKRTISLYDGKTIHPSKLIDAEQANISLIFDGASFWHISRLSNLYDHDQVKDASILFDNYANNNIIDRWHVKDYFYGVKIRPYCDNNTIQLSYFNHMTHEGRLSDNVALAISTNGVENVVTEGTRFIANDIRNAGDGVQLIRSSNVSSGSYPDTIIDSNNIWMDGDVRTNGDYATNGYNPLGEYQIGEEAMDLKIGSDDATKPVIITNNVMHGYRSGDGTAGGGQSTGAGTCFTAHYGVKNVIFEHNIMYDSEVGIGISGTISEFAYSIKDWSIKHNVFANLGLVNPTDRTAYMNLIYFGENVKFEENVFNNCQRNSLDEGYFFRWEDSLGSTFKKNIIIDSHGTSSWYNHDNPSLNDGVSIIDIDNNYFYDSTESMNGINEHIFSTIEEANMISSSFTVETLEETTTYTLPFTESTELSPHY